MFGCYRKDEVQDPDVYCAAVAATLSLYSKSVVDIVTDPRTGIPSESKWLPNVAEVREFCNRQAKRESDLAKPRVDLGRKQYYPPLKVQNLFVPEGFPRYDKMVERSKAEGHGSSRFERDQLCQDGKRRPGIWIPYSWWAQPR